MERPLAHVLQARLNYHWLASSNFLKLFYYCTPQPAPEICSFASGDVRMVCIGLPRRLVIFPRLITPGGPAPTRTTPKHFEVRPRRTIFDQIILLVRLARVLSLSRLDHINLPSRGCK